jgi:hypothetical protein
MCHSYVAYAKSFLLLSASFATVTIKRKDICTVTAALLFCSEDPGTEDNAYSRRNHGARIL